MDTDKHRWKTGSGLKAIASLRRGEHIGAAGLKTREAAEQQRSEGKNMFEPVGLGAQDDDDERQFPDFILMRQVFVHRQEDIELAGVRDEAKQFAVADAGPAGLRHGFN